MSFNASHIGYFHAVLKINFRDRTRPNDQEFTVTRELRGHATLSISGGPAWISEVPHILNKTAEDEDAGIIVWPDFALDFSVETALSNESFATQIKEIVITRSSNTQHILVSFTEARIYSPETSMIE